MANGEWRMANEEPSGEGEVRPWTEEWVEDAAVFGVAEAFLVAQQQGYLRGAARGAARKVALFLRNKGWGGYPPSAR